jgi:hypothetical protein
MRVLGTGLAAVLIALVASAPAPAAVPLAATYNATITGGVYEWNAQIGSYQQTGVVNLPALLFVEQRRISPVPTSPVVGLFTGSTPALDQRAGAINFATNTQGFHVNPNVVGPTQAAIDIATVQADQAANTIRAQVDTGSARTVTVELFRTSTSFISAPAQILFGTMTLQFSPDGRTVTGSFDLAGNGLIEPGNPLIYVRRYIANVSGQATAVTLPPVGLPPGPAAPAADLAGARVARGRAVAVALSCTTACRARARLSISRRAARRAGLRRTAIGSASVERAGAGAFTLRTPVSRRARRALRRLRRVRVTVRVVVTTSDGVAHRFRRRVTLGR